MPERQQEIYNELVDSAGGARMLGVRDVAQFIGRDDRAARKFLREKELPRYDVNGLFCYAARDVAKALYLSEA
jgi:hypothetical protein